MSKTRQYVRTMKMQLKVGALTMRAAFSHIPFWQSTIWMTQQVILQPCPGNIATGGSVVDQLDKVGSVVTAYFSVNCIAMCSRWQELHGVMQTFVPI